MNDLHILKKTVEEAEHKFNSRMFCEFIFDTLRQFIAFDSGWVGIVRTENNQLKDVPICFLDNQPTQLVKNYIKYNHLDPMPERIVPERAVRYIDLLSYEQFVESPFFLKTCQPFDTHFTLAIISKIPYTNGDLYLSLFRAKESGPFSNADLWFFQYSWHFISGLLRGKFGVSHYQTAPLFNDLEIDKVDKITPSEWRLLEVMFYKNIYENKRLARYLDREPRTIERQLHALYDIVDGKKDKLISLLPSLFEMRGTRTPFQ